jgi:hypothetical protein
MITQVFGVLNLTMQMNAQQARKQQGVIRPTSKESAALKAQKQTEREGITGFEWTR